MLQQITFILVCTLLAATSVSSKDTIKSVICPDGTSYCPDGNTCCNAGCCPYQNGICCIDNTCCPAGYECGPDNKCLASGRRTLPALELRKISKPKTAPRNVSKMQDIVCPNGGECKDGYTCCLLTLDYNKYSCCAESNAVCCQYGWSCCPKGTVCGSDNYCYRSGQAAQKALETAIVTKQTKASTNQISKPKTVPRNPIKSSKLKTVSRNPTKSVQNLVCPDGGECSYGDTCCKNIYGTYGCCSYSSAVCCADGVHCCRYGTFCSGGRCYFAGSYSSSRLLQLLKTSTRNLNEV